MVCSHGSKPMRAPLPRFSLIQAGGGVSTRLSIVKIDEIDLAAHLQRVAAVDEDDSARSRRISATPAEPAKPVSQRSRSEPAATYSP